MSRSRKVRIEISLSVLLGPGMLAVRNLELFRLESAKPAAGKLDELIGRLDDPDLAIRDAATNELRGWMPAARERIAAIADSDDAEVKARARLLLSWYSSTHGVLELSDGSSVPSRRK